MSLLTVYTVRRSSSLISEYFDDEILVANLTEGMYYSLRFVAVDLWKALETGATTEQLIALINQLYNTEGVDVQASVEEFIGQLHAYQLLADSDTAFSAFVLPAAESKKAFVQPELAVHDDMQDLLALDPIHDVDGEEGWPIRK